jgi:TRAP-type C4-dicarboxylate transport system permease small subunit
VAMIGSSIAIRQLDHVGITFLVDALPRRLALGIYYAGAVLVAIFLAVFVWYSLRLTLEMGPRQVSSSLGLSMAYAYASLPIGGAMMLVQLVAASLEGYLRHSAGHSPFLPAQTAV